MSKADPNAPKRLALIASKGTLDWAYPPFILAGGLTPANVAVAIATLHPAGVDTASGVESSPGRKDPRLVEQFVREARAAFLSVRPQQP